MWDPGVIDKFSGQFVVALPGEVVAAGPDEDAVRAMAAEKLGLAVEDVMICFAAPPETRVYPSWS